MKTKLSGFRFSQEIKEKLQELAKDYRGNKTLVLEKLIENAFNLKNNNTLNQNK